MLPRSAVWLLVACAAGASGCSRSSSDADHTPTPDDVSADARVRVENRGFSDMNIFLLQGGQRIRLGTVSGNSTSTLTIRRQYLSTGPLRFLADPIGSDRTPVSDEIVVQPGDIVTLMIPP